MVSMYSCRTCRAISRLWIIRNSLKYLEGRRGDGGRGRGEGWRKGEGRGREGGGGHVSIIMSKIILVCSIILIPRHSVPSVGVGSGNEAREKAAPVVEQLVLQHLVVGHGLTELVYLLQEELPSLGNCLQFQFVNLPTDVIHRPTVVKILKSKNKGTVKN